MTDIQNTAEDIHDEFADHLDIDLDDVTARLDRLVSEYKVPLGEARRSVENHYLDEAGLERDDLVTSGTDEEAAIADIDGPEQWVTITAKVVDLWDPRSDAVGQVGLLADETGRMKFTAWAEPDLETLEEGQVYRLENVVSDEYEGDVSVKLNRTTTITEVDEELDVSQTDEEEMAIADIDQPETWTTLTAQVTDLWEPRSDAVGQVGLLGDETGTIKFTAWAKSDLPTLEEGQVYRLENVVTDEYEGRYSVKLNRRTEISELDEEIEVGDDDTTMEGAMVDMQEGSGLIKRCPVEDCTRVLQNGRCSEHGDVEGTFDLRIKGVFDDGKAVQDVIFDREATEELTGIDLETAKEMAQDALDTTVVAEEMEETVLGRYYRVTGPIMGRYLLANEVEELTEPVDPDDVLIRARSM